MTLALRVPGSCGELAQGVVDGVRLHISCPIDRYTYFSENRRGSFFVSRGWKSRQVLFLSEKAGFPSLTRPHFFYSDLPVGNGMASSTADMAAVLWFTGKKAGIALAPEEVGRFLLSIEPTDGVIFPGIVLYDHYRGKHLSRLGDPPPLEIVAVDFGGEVDTVAYNQRDLKKVSRGQTGNVLRAFHLIREGIRESSIFKIGEGATISALAHQNILRKPYLEKILKITTDLGGVGVNVAHSGSVIGMLFRPGSINLDLIRETVRTAVKDPFTLHRLRLRGGGPEWFEPYGGKRS